MPSTSTNQVANNQVSLLPLWSEQPPNGHLVQFYEDEAFLIEALGNWFGEGLGARDACIFIGTDAHRISLEKRLHASGIDIEAARQQGRYICLDADRTLATILNDGWPDDSLFSAAIEKVVTRAARFGGVRAFGEMVALLWNRGKQRAAIRLEEIWNAFMATHALSLCCAYQINAEAADTDASLFSRICATHSAVIPAESYSALSSPAERLRSVTMLQHKAQLLERESTQRKNAERSLRLQRRELADFIESAVEGIHQLGPDGRILWANPSQLNLLGCRAGEYIGHHLSEYYVDRDRFDQFWQRLMKREIIYDFDAALRCRDGSIKHVLIHSSGRWKDDVFLYTRCFIRDVTVRLELEEQLRARLADLAQADQRKDEFLAMLGHELRNPVAAVFNAITAAQLDGSRCAQALNIARRQINQLAGLVDDLLDVGRITRGRILLKKEAVQAGVFLRQALEEAHCMIETGSHQLSVFISPEAETAFVEADPTRMRQVLGNLIHNAAKFTAPGGRIDVVAQVENDNLVIRVRDSGIGISPELLPHVFELFTQAKHSLDRRAGGLGIGLTLVKRLVEMHGGHVLARSAGLGNGSEFEIQLPLLPGARACAQTAEEIPVMAPLARTLVVEDNGDAAEALTMLLDTYGYQSTIAEDGLTAVEAVRTGDFDIALIDIGLPGIDGYEVARRIRALQAGKPIVLVALTGYGQESDKERALAAGFDEHLTKPLNIEALRALLGRIQHR